ncbi:immunity 53 family protein [Roseivirga sp. BDSF3-8]|uniref:immunity 53 family protein n=1 Tax=Roseivirga sp. BDSF3-8 TaxID=3241598 RepID=UPI0035321BA3
MKNILFIQNWFASQCDGDWEHDYGVKIETIDNPGWSVEIDLKDTVNETLSIEYQLMEKSKNDWYGYQVKDGVFSGGGDPSKLTVLLDIFINLIVEQ